MNASLVLNVKKATKHSHSLTPVKKTLKRPSFAVYAKDTHLPPSSGVIVFPSQE